MLCLGEGALLVLGPDSSSFTFPNSGWHRRHLGHKHKGLLCQTCQRWQLDGCYCVVVMPACSGMLFAFCCGEPTRLAHVLLLSDCLPRFCEIRDRINESRCQGLHAQSVHWCAYDNSPKPKLQKIYKWLPTWPGIRTLNARCKCKELHRKLRRTPS